MATFYYVTGGDRNSRTWFTDDKEYAERLVSCSQKETINKNIQTVKAKDAATAAAKLGLDFNFL